MSTQPMFPSFSFSIADLETANACWIPRRWQNLIDTFGRNVARDDSFNINVWWKLEFTTPLDVVWSIRMDQVNEAKVAYLVMLKAVRLTFAKFVELYPDDMRLHPFMEYIEQHVVRNNFDEPLPDFDEKHRELSRLCFHYEDKDQWRRAYAGYALLNTLSCFCPDPVVTPENRALFVANRANDVYWNLPVQIRDYIFELYRIQQS